MNKAFEFYHKEKKEGMKVDTLKCLRRLVVEAFYTHVLKPLESDQVSKLEKSRKVTFMPVLADQLIKYLTDYFDNVREQAQALVAAIVHNFIPFNEQFSKAQEQTLNMLRANALGGWGENMKTQVKNAADMEAELSKHIFSDP